MSHRGTGEFPHNIRKNSRGSTHCTRDTGGRPHLRYDIDEWKRRCKRLDLATPALCFIEPAARVPQSKRAAQEGGGEPSPRADALRPPN